MTKVALKIKSIVSFRIKEAKYQSNHKVAGSLQSLPQDIVNEIILLGKMNSLRLGISYYYGKEGTLPIFDTSVELPRNLSEN